MCLTYVTKRYKKKRTSGWAYKVLADINDHTVLTPYQSGAHTFGVQWGADVIVADEIYIPKTRKKMVK